MKVKTVVGSLCGLLFSAGVAAEYPCASQFDDFFKSYGLLEDVTESANVRLKIEDYVGAQAQFERLLVESRTLTNEGVKLLNNDSCLPKYSHEYYRKAMESAIIGGMGMAVSLRKQAESMIVNIDNALSSGNPSTYLRNIRSPQR